MKACCTETWCIKSERKWKQSCAASWSDLTISHCDAMNVLQKGKSAQQTLVKQIHSRVNTTHAEQNQFTSTNYLTTWWWSWFLEPENRNRFLSFSIFIHPVLFFICFNNFLFCFSCCFLSCLIFSLLYYFTLPLNYFIFLCCQFCLFFLSNSRIFPSCPASFKYIFLPPRCLRRDSDSLDSGIVSSNPAQGIGLCPRLSVLCSHMEYSPCIGLTPVQGVLRNLELICNFRTNSEL
jgi:hypothetical protein